MAQAGIHAMVGAAIRKWVPKKEWLILGVVLGNLFPDMDNLAVAVATLMKLPTAGIHRTATHSVPMVIFAMLVFYVWAAVTKNPRWQTFGIGFGIGILMHILLDLLLWFNGVELFWPFPSWVNLWANYTPPDWFMKLMDPAEMLFFGLFYLMLISLARKQNTDMEYLRRLRTWMIVQFVLFVVFTFLVYVMSSGFRTIHGVFYLLSLFQAFYITIHMQRTVEAI